MKTYFVSALFLGATLISCTKEKKEVDQNDSMSTGTLPSDTSMTLPPSDSTALNAPLNAGSATPKDSGTTSVQR